MPDNLTTTPIPSTVPAGSTIATDDVAGVHFQKVKIDIGGDGISTPISLTTPMPVWDANSSLTVDAVTWPLPSGAATAARQASPGPPGTPSAEVMTIQGHALMTPLQVEMAPTSLQSVTIEGSIPLASGAATLSQQVDQTDLLTILASWNLLGRAKIAMGYAPPANTWSYAPPPGGLTTSSGVSARSAAGAGLRHYITRAQVVNGHATVSTDVQIRDGASGVVLWRVFANALGGGAAAEFDPPLRGSINTLIEVACNTSGAAVYINLQGYTEAS